MFGSCFDRFGPSGVSGVFGCICLSQFNYISARGVFEKSTPFWLELLFSPTNFLITSGGSLMHAHSITMKECARVTRFLVVHMFGWLGYGS